MVNEAKTMVTVTQKMLSVAFTMFFATQQIASAQTQSSIPGAYSSCEVGAETFIARKAARAAAISWPFALMMPMSSSGVRVSTTGFLLGLTALRCPASAGNGVFLDLG